MHHLLEWHGVQGMHIITEQQLLREGVMSCTASTYNLFYYLFVCVDSIWILQLLEEEQDIGIVKIS